MHLYNGYQKIKCGVRRLFVKPNVGPNAAEDAQMLSMICSETHTMAAMNRVNYWYYFVDDTDNIELARYLLKRNGVVPTFRMSRYNRLAGTRRPAFRLSVSYLAKHAEIFEFLKKIRPQREINVKNMEQTHALLAEMRMTLRQK